jgi:hypothetical protein
LGDVDDRVSAISGRARLPLSAASSGATLVTRASDGRKMLRTV